MCVCVTGLSIGRGTRTGHASGTRNTVPDTVLIQRRYRARYSRYSVLVTYIPRRRRRTTRLTDSRLSAPDPPIYMRREEEEELFFFVLRYSYLFLFLCAEVCMAGAWPSFGTNSTTRMNKIGVCVRHADTMADASVRRRSSVIVPPQPQPALSPG